MSSSIVVQMRRGHLTGSLSLKIICRQVVLTSNMNLHHRQEVLINWTFIAEEFRLCNLLFRKWYDRKSVWAFKREFMPHACRSSPRMPIVSILFLYLMIAPQIRFSHWFAGVRLPCRSFGFNRESFNIWVRSPEQNLDIDL